MTEGVGVEILSCLARVERQRELRGASPTLSHSTQALKAFQQERFRRAYADLLADPRHSGAARFFLEELYGPADFSRRDAQFQRIVRPLVRLFPQEVVNTVLHLAQLHALSEELDSEMAHCLPAHEPGGLLNANHYVAAWRQVGRQSDRAQQIELTLAVGRALDVYTRKPLLRHALRLMRAPASAAGLQELQAFLECGFETFRAMQGAERFLDTVGTREHRLAAELFEGDKAGQFCALMAWC